MKTHPNPWEKLYILHMEEMNESTLDFYNIKDLAMRHMPSGQFSILSVKFYFKGLEDSKPSRAFRISNTKNYWHLQ